MTSDPSGYYWHVQERNSYLLVHATECCKGSFVSCQTQHFSKAKAMYNAQLWMEWSAWPVSGNTLWHLKHIERWQGLAESPERPARYRLQLHFHLPRTWTDGAHPAAMCWLGRCSIEVLYYLYIRLRLHCAFCLRVSQLEGSSRLSVSSKRYFVSHPAYEYFQVYTSTSNWATSPFLFCIPYSSPSQISKHRLPSVRGTICVSKLVQRFVRCVVKEIVDSKVEINRHEKRDTRVWNLRHVPPCSAGRHAIG